MQVEQDGAVWAAKELSGIGFGDKRLDVRSVRLLKSFYDAPEKSIAGAQNGWAETCSAYRFFDNDKVTHERILDQHRLATLERAAQHPLIVAIHDTTSFNFSGLKATSGLGDIGDSKHKPDVQGLIAHHCYLITPERTPLGLLHQKLWARAPSKFKDSKVRVRTHISKKESFKWVVSVDDVARLTQSLPNTKVVHVMDREADIFDVFSEAKDINQNFLIRAFHNRKVNKKSRGSNDGVKMFDHSNRSKPDAIVSLELPTREGLDVKRIAEVEIRFTQVEITAPRAKSMKVHEFSNERVVLTYISAREVESDSGYEPIEWHLLTNVPIDSVEQAIYCLDLYTCRWQVEVFHRLLKTGFKVESARLSDAKKIEAFVAMISICAWRMHWVTLTPRQEPKASAEPYFSELERKILVAKVLGSKPRKRLLLKDYINLLARLGGFLNRKSDGSPGPEVLWRGWRKLRAAVEAVEALVQNGIVTYV